ncbi:MAG: hypothetical protein ABSD63_04840 [Candidatus Korobacteraceae bacterium]|jgi:hypothetical protein
MDIKHFGDSYDIVKQSLLRWLRDFGEWSVHPMFTGSIAPNDPGKFANFLNAKIISADVLDGDTERSDYFACALSSGNLFLDPTTGLCLKSRPKRKRAAYLYASELIQLTNQRTGSLTMVFDQSLARGKERAQLMNKLQHLLHHNVRAFAYCSHACFIVASRNRALVDQAYEHIIRESRLPESRFVRTPPVSRHVGA